MKVDIFTPCGYTGCMDEKPAPKKKRLPPKKKIELTTQQMDFVTAVVTMGFRRKGDAYLAAYPTCKKSAADACASRLLKNAKIKDAIQSAYSEILGEKKKYLEQEIFDFWYVRMTYDPTEIIDLNGELVMSTEELRRRGLHVVVDQINQKMSKQGPYVEYKLADRDRAAERLQEYIHMIKPQDQNINVASLAVELPIGMSPEKRKEAFDKLMGRT